MSGELLEMARSGITLLPGEAAKVAAAYDKMKAERDQLRSVLALLREPSEAVMAGAFSAGAIWDVVTHTRKTIQLAVAAAEQEVRRA